MQELRIAFRNILRQKRRSLLSGLALLVCYVLFSLQESLIEGTYGHMIDLFTRDHTGHVQLHRKGFLDSPSISKGMDGWGAIESKLTSMSEVLAFAPRVKGGALAYAGSKSTPVQVIGIDPEKESRTSTLKERVKKGAYLDAAPGVLMGAAEGAIHKAMIGEAVARNLRVSLGDELVLVSQGADGSIANERYRVGGIVGTMDSWDQLNVYLSLPAAQEFFALDARFHEIAIRLRHFSLAEEFARRLEPALNSLAGGQQALSIDPWQVIEEGFYRAMVSERKGKVFSKFILLIIVGIGVLNAILMSVLERTREYGVLKAVGTRPAGIFRLILIESGLLALLSVGAGLLVAIPVNYWFETTGIDVPPIDIGGVPYSKMLGELSARTILVPAFTILLATILTALFPAVKAARIKVVEALRSN